MPINKGLKKTFFYVVLIATPFLFIELAMRIFLAIWLAPNVFFYGTGLVRTEIQQKIATFDYETKEEYKSKTEGKTACYCTCN